MKIVVHLRLSKQCHEAVLREQQRTGNTKTRVIEDCIADQLFTTIEALNADYKDFKRYLKSKT
jgi:hypothetical protein